MASANLVAWSRLVIGVAILFFNHTSTLANKLCLARFRLSGLALNSTILASTFKLRLDSSSVHPFISEALRVIQNGDISKEAHHNDI
jgi:hypothetical protein